MKTDLYNQQGEVIDAIDLPDRIFSVAMNHDLVHQVLVAQMANARHPYAHTKGRGEVRGGGRKPWRQKGTGRARHGSRRSPIWKGGGVTFGPTAERNFSKRINKKMKTSALFMVLSSKAKDKQLLVLDSLNFEKPKTKEAAVTLKRLSNKLHGYSSGKKGMSPILLVIPESDPKIKMSVSNIPFIRLENARSLNAKDVLNEKYMVLLKNAVPVIEKTYKTT